MGRLIDTSAFDEITIKDKSEDFIDGAKYILDLIDAQPTAYDTERVVAELEMYSSNIYSESGECWEKYVYLETAKQTVKKGGVE